MSVDEIAGTALITVRRTGYVDETSTAAYSTSDFGTTAGADYTVTNGTLSFAAGETEKTISVPIIDDSAIEVGEAFRVVISAPSGAFLGAITTITVAINDNDDRGAFEFSTASSAVAESVGNVMLTIVRDSAIGSASVSYATVSGTASEGSDFTATSGTATFAEGVTQQTIAIPIVSDSLYEELESFTVQLSAPTIGARLGTQAAHTIGIQNDDPDPGVIVFTSASSSVQEAAGSIVLNISRNSTIGTVSVNYAASGATATAGSDFTAVSGTVTFADGQSAQTITVPIANDTVFELDETFTVQLSAPTIGARIGAVGTHTVTIQSDEAPPAFSFAAASSLVEESAGSIVVTVSRQGDTATACSVAYATASGTATAGADFTMTSGVLDFPAAQTQRTIVVPITADSTVENDETFSIALSSPTSGAVLGATSTHSVTIRGTTKLGFATNVFSVGENDGTAQITVLRTGSTVAAASVAYSTSAGTAADGTDFTGTSGTLSFAAGETEKTIAVPVLTDAIAEADETFTITLASPTGGILGSIATAQVTIENVVAKIKGSYHGLARRAAGTGLGGITIASTEKDRISGKLLLGGATYKFSGSIDAAARFSQTLSVKVGTAKVPRVLALARSHDGSRYSGTFTLEDSTVYNIDARIDATRDDAPVKADYNATLEATGLAGILRTSVKTTGKIVLAGSLPDGTTISGGSALAKDGTTAIFIPLYSRKLGYLGGLATLASGAISGPLSWEKPAGLRGPHAGGFDDQSLALSGALYTTTPGHGVLDDFETTIGHGNAYFTGGGLAADAVLPVTVSGRNKIEFPGAAGKTTKLKMDAATGFISGTFTDAAGKRHAVKAIAIPQTGAGNDTARGFFLSDTTSGIVELVAE